MKSRTDFHRRAKTALLEGARKASSLAVYGVEKNFPGYATTWESNLYPSLPFQVIRKDLYSGSGGELREHRNGAPPKICAAHSSAALAINMFGLWRQNPNGFRIGGKAGFATMQFEKRLPTGLGGTPPNLDLVADGDELVAVEMKCTEWMKRKPATFEPSYGGLARIHGQTPWFKQLTLLKAQPSKYAYVDAAQLVKHALGLMTLYPTRQVNFLYVFWEPINADDWPQCSLHRKEANDFAAEVNTSNVRLKAMSCRELWVPTASSYEPEHIKYLETRYDRPVWGGPEGQTRQFL